jgi:protein-tyrosine phosphatase
LRTGVLVRTASLAGVTPEGVAKLADLDVRTVLDLRGDEEVARDGVDVVPKGTEVLRLPFGVSQRSDDGESADMASILSKLVGSRSAAEIGTAIMLHVYQGFIIDPAAHTAVSTALTTIADSQDAVLVHCTAGKDRTGWVVSLTEAICGLSEADILVDYLLSSNAAGQLAASMHALPGIDPDVWDAILTVHPEYLGAAQQLMQETYGTLNGYLDAIGVGAGVRDAIRVRFGVTSKE